MRKLEEYLAYLSVDGGWHSLSDVGENISLEGEKVDVITDLFAEFNFVEQREEGVKVRITPSFRKIYQEP